MINLVNSGNAKAVLVAAMLILSQASTSWKVQRLSLTGVGPSKAEAQDTLRGDDIVRSTVKTAGKRAGLYQNNDYKTYVINYAEGPKESFFKMSPTHRMHGIEIAESSNSPRYSTSALSCTPIFACGKGALGVAELGGSGFEIIIKRPGPSTVSEPFNLAMKVSFKLRSTAAVLNVSAGVIGLCNEAGV